MPTLRVHLLETGRPAMKRRRFKRSAVQVMPGCTTLAQNVETAADSSILPQLVSENANVCPALNCLKAESCDSALVDSKSSVASIEADERQLSWHR